MLTATAAGVDTWSPSWYCDDASPAFREFWERCTVRTAAGGRMLPDRVAAHRVGAYPGGLVFAEGHPGEPGDLSPAADLLEAAWRLSDALEASGVPISPGRHQRGARAGRERLTRFREGFAGYRRADATVNLDGGSASETIALLAGIAAIARDAPGHAEVRFGLDRRVETVYLRGYAGKRVLGRAYDKSFESLGVRGRTARLEDQRRWGREDRPGLEEFSAERLRGRFHRRFLPLYRASKGVTVSGPVVLAEKLVAYVEAGEMTAREAESLAGHMLLSVAGGRRGAGISRATAYRREARLREAGLVLADGLLEEVEVDVSVVLEAALESDAWDRRG